MENKIKSQIVEKLNFNQFTEFKKQVKEPIGQTEIECYNLYNFVIDTYDIPGNLVEIGVFAGGTSRIIHSFMNKNKKLYMIDTFSGVQDSDSLLDGKFNIQVYNEKTHGFSEQTIRKSFDYENVSIIKGYFPDCDHNLSDETFSFVHLDTDTYKSTYKCLEFFYPRMSTSAILVCHDYHNKQFTGVTEAFNTFMRDKESIDKYPDTQGVFRKK